MLLGGARATPAEAKRDEHNHLAVRPSDRGHADEPVRRGRRSRRLRGRLFVAALHCPAAHDYVKIQQPFVSAINETNGPSSVTAACTLARCDWSLSGSKLPIRQGCSSAPLGAQRPGYCFGRPRLFEATPAPMLEIESCTGTRGQDDGRPTVVRQGVLVEVPLSKRFSTRLRSACRARRFRCGAGLSRARGLLHL